MCFHLNCTMDINSSNESILCPHLIMSHTKNPLYFDYTTGIIVCVVNGLLAIPTTILNVLLILSILSTPSLRRPSYILICALAFTDVGVGILVQPLYIARKITFLLADYETYCFLLQIGNVFSHICCSPSFFIVTAISIDRYLAITLRMTYASVVTIKVVLMYLAFTIVCAGCVTVARFRATSPKYMSIAAVMMCLILATILYCYFKSLRGLATVQAQITGQDEHHSRSGTSASSHRRVLATLMVIVVTLFCCYVPFVAVVVTMAVFGRTRSFMVAWEMGLTLLYLNSFLNPILHFARIKELRNAAIAVFNRT